MLICFRGVATYEVVALHIALARIPGGACRGTADMSDLTRLWTRLWL